MTGACQPDERGGDASVDREVAGDTVHVRNHGPVHRDTAVLREVARIGTPDGNEQTMLNQVSAFAQLPDGRIILADDAGLRAFTPEGEFRERIARRGKGPGEVEFVTGLAAMPDGTLLAVDLGNRRINVYRPDAEPDQWPMPPGAPGYGRGSIIVTEDGAVYAAINPGLATDDSPMAWPRPVFVRLAAGGAVADTLYADARFTQSCPTLSSATWRAGFYEDLREPYFPKVKWALGPGGVLAVGCPSRYEIDLIQPDGRVTRISRDREPASVSDEEREAFVDVQTFTRNRNGYFESWSWEGPRPPAQRPAYDRMFFAEDGRLWVWPSQPGERREVPEQFTRLGAPPVSYDMSATGEFDVFEADGTYVGAVRLPANVPYTPFPGRSDPFVRGDTMWALQYDSLDVPYLTRYIVEWKPVPPNGSGGIRRP